jgi:uncharacterized protein YlxP (DUF503 family)
MRFEAPDESIWVGVLRVVVVVPGSRSLKDKRRVIAQTKDRIRARHDLSVAEVGYLDDSMRSVLAVAMVSSDHRLIESTLGSIETDIRDWGNALVEEQSIDIARPYPEDASEFDY